MVVTSVATLWHYLKRKRLLSLRNRRERLRASSSRLLPQVPVDRRTSRDLMTSLNPAHLLRLRDLVSNGLVTSVPVAAMAEANRWPLAVVEDLSLAVVPVASSSLRPAMLVSRTINAEAVSLAMPAQDPGTLTVTGVSPITKTRTRTRINKNHSTSSKVAGSNLDTVRGLL